MKIVEVNHSYIEDWIHVYDNLVDLENRNYSDWDYPEAIIEACRNNTLQFSLPQSSYLFFHHLNKVPYYANV